MGSWTRHSVRRHPIARFCLLAEPGPHSCALVSNVYLLLDYGNFADSGDDGGLGIHSLTPRIYWCMYHPVGYARGLTQVDLILIYHTVVVFFHSSGR